MGISSAAVWVSGVQWGVFCFGVGEIFCEDIVDVPVVVFVM